MFPLEEEEELGEYGEDEEGSEEGDGLDDPGSMLGELLPPEGEQAARIRANEATKKACFFMCAPLIDQSNCMQRDIPLT